MHIHQKTSTDIKNGDSRNTTEITLFRRKHQKPIKRKNTKPPSDKIKNHLENEEYTKFTVETVSSSKN